MFISEIHATTLKRGSLATFLMKGLVGHLRNSTVYPFVPAAIDQWLLQPVANDIFQGGRWAATATKTALVDSQFFSNIFARVA